MIVPPTCFFCSCFMLGFYSFGSDAYDSGTVYSLQTILFLRKLCGLTFFLLIEVIHELIRFCTHSKISLRLSNVKCHTISRVYPSKTVWAHFAWTYHRELEIAWQFDTTWSSQFQQTCEDLTHTFWCTCGVCSWLVGWQKKKLQACVTYLSSLGYLQQSQPCTFLPSPF